jgi:hypothetical protein
MHFNTGEVGEEQNIFLGKTYNVQNKFTLFELRIQLS